MFLRSPGSVCTTSCRTCQQAPRRNHVASRSENKNGISNFDESAFEKKKSSSEKVAHGNMSRKEENTITWKAR